MPAPLCVDCGKPVLEASFRVARHDPNPSYVCRRCRGARGGRTQANNAAGRRASRVFEVALAARERTRR